MIPARSAIRGSLVCELFDDQDRDAGCAIRRTWARAFDDQRGETHGSSSIRSTGLVAGPRHREHLLLAAERAGRLFGAPGRKLVNTFEHVVVRRPYERRHAEILGHAEIREDAATFGDGHHRRASASGVHR